MLENRNLIKPKKAITLLKPMCFHSHQFKNYYIKEEKKFFQNTFIQNKSRYKFAPKNKILKVIYVHNLNL